jgi:DNA-binding CsgD family transcriptional regulator
MTWPQLSVAEERVLAHALRFETARADRIAAELGYSAEYVRQVLKRLRKAFDVHENAALLLRAERSKQASMSQSGG